MAYHIKKEWNNGYRCGCCSRSWEDDKWLENREEAIAEVGTSAMIKGGDLELLSVEVIDGATGTVIAEGKLDWMKWGRGYYYRYSRWSGTITNPDETCERFEIIEPKTDKTWKELCDEAETEHKKRELEKARAELEQAQKKLAKLGG